MHKISKKKKKFRLLLDSAFARSSAFPNLQKKVNLIHVVWDLKLSPQVEDEEIYQKATNEKRIVLTINFKDFKKLAKEGKAGVFGVESQLSNEDIDKKVCKFISGKNPQDFIGKATKVS
ncbi:MAG: DUF5615 family PIN-like protein [Candidatus Daviesbacteria bacterium]|nr:DUF5615 family PIN-like protein [Candidatus Daviesbacteria bacterium]